MIYYREEENRYVLHVKWCIDDATDLKEAARWLRESAIELEALAAKGWELEEPVVDGSARITTDDPEELYRAKQAHLQALGRIPEQ